LGRTGSAATGTNGSLGTAAASVDSFNESVFGEGLEGTKADAHPTRANVIATFIFSIGSGDSKENMNAMRKKSEEYIVESALHSDKR